MPFRVYYLDDEESLCNIFSEFINSKDVHVTTFVDPSEAIKICKKNPPDLFFIDYRLPGTTGDIVASDIDENIPKILVTGDISIHSTYDFQQILSKPLDFNNIQKLIDSYL